MIGVWLSSLDNFSKSVQRYHATVSHTASLHAYAVKCVTALGCTGNVPGAANSMGESANVLHGWPHPAAPASGFGE